MEIWIIGVILLFLLIIARFILEKRNKKLKAKAKEAEDELLKNYKLMLTSARLSMYYYWKKNNIDRLRMGITKIDLDFDDDGVFIEVLLENPGVMIGKGGRHVNGLTEELKKDFKYDKLRIKITEDKTWWDIKKMSYEV